MATWVTHLIVADRVLERLPKLDRRGFCVGNIAPDCNIENEDWSSFTPSREVTHWMSGERKSASDCDAFCKEYILDRQDRVLSPEEYSFLLGYYSHLLTDVAFQSMILDEARVKAMWGRIKSDNELSRAACGMEESWASAKELIPKHRRMQEIYNFEAEYLENAPSSGYLTEILPLTAFPDYIDYLPHGCIARKIGVMGYTPELDKTLDPITVSRREYSEFIERTVRLVINMFSAIWDIPL